MGTECNEGREFGGAGCQRPVDEWQQLRHRAGPGVVGDDQTDPLAIDIDAREFLGDEVLDGGRVEETLRGADAVHAAIGIPHQTFRHMHTQSMDGVGSADKGSFQPKANVGNLFGINLPTQTIAP